MDSASKSIVFEMYQALKFLELDIEGIVERGQQLTNEEWSMRLDKIRIICNEATKVVNGTNKIAECAVCGQKIEHEEDLACEDCWNYTAI